MPVVFSTTQIEYFDARSVDIWSEQSSWSAHANLVNDEARKRLFGIELAKDHESPFEAACEVFKDDTNAALWVTVHWINDPVVIAARDTYQKQVQDRARLLDKDQLAIKLLELEAETLPNGSPRHEAKDRLAALKLYSEVQGFTGKAEPVATNNYIQKMEVVFIEPKEQQQPTKTIEHQDLEIQAPITDNLDIVLVD